MKKFKAVVLSMCALMFSKVYACNNINNSFKQKTFIEHAIKSAFSNDAASSYTKYFSTNYVQVSDGKTLNYEDFVKHINVVKSSIKTIKFTFNTVIVEGDTVVTNHIVDAVKKDGSLIKAEVIAIFIIKNGKIISCHELSRLIVGDKKDADMAHRT